MSTVEELAPKVGVASACRGLGVSRATIYRRRRPAVAADRQSRHTLSPRRLREHEREQVLDVLRSARFVDKAPGEVYATLLDEGIYLCSERTMYRILADKNEVRERRNQLRHPSYTKPELLATRPNQVWSWDITKLKGPRKWSYYYLYVILDIFSRYVPGWMIAERESATLARRLFDETVDKESIVPGQLTIHADRGASMRSKLVAQLLADLGITKTHSRPHVSNDNPYSESQFKTLKYRPDFPSRFGSLEDACCFSRPFFHWYNHEHRHSGIAMLTPATVHRGHAQDVLAARNAVLASAYRRHAERFVRGRSRARPLSEAAWINPPVEQAARRASEDLILQ